MNLEATPIGRVYSEKESSTILEISYDKEQFTMDVIFRKNSNRYRYFDVPHKLFVEAFENKSIGSFVATKLKGNFRYAAIEEPVGETPVEKIGNVHIDN
jgi:hypothetical protein